MENKLTELKSRLEELTDLQRVQALLAWDQLTNLPDGGAQARARQISVISTLAQEKAIDPALGHLLDELEPYAQSLPYDSFEASLIRVARRDYEQAVKVPPEFMGRFNQHIAETYPLWAQARQENRFDLVRKNLEKSVELSREFARYFSGYEHIADPLINQADYGMKVSTLRPLFAELRRELVPLVQEITSRPTVDDSCLRQNFPKEGQLSYSREISSMIGFDYNRGRMDLSAHPFSISFSNGDVRLTTRVRTDYLVDCLFSIIHEAGHGMYEQGGDPSIDGTPLESGTSAGVHESQSRLWENIVGRSLPFWKYAYPSLQKTFPEQLNHISLNEFYQAINKVEASLIRSDADEVTYNLHIMIRFELELELLEGKLSVDDLPEVWRARYTEYLGITPPNDTLGVLQDMHWFSGPVGGEFQGYSLGNILSAQFYGQALKAHPEIPAEIEAGKFSTLLGWLQQNIYCHGRKFTASELIERVTGGPIKIEPYIRYLKTKYAA